MPTEMAKTNWNSIVYLIKCFIRSYFKWFLNDYGIAVDFKFEMLDLKIDYCKCFSFSYHQLYLTDLVDNLFWQISGLVSATEIADAWSESATNVVVVDVEAVTDEVVVVVDEVDRTDPKPPPVEHLMATVLDESDLEEEKRLGIGRHRDGRVIETFAPAYGRIYFK